jgi:uncharacterized protein (DUF58 family)
MPATARRAAADPRALARLGDLALVARVVVDGLGDGSHRSRTAGAGLEFSQYRSYEPGDDPRRLDWKLLARSDRYFVREAETESSIALRLVLDATASMAYAEDGVSKLDCARWAAAGLAAVAHRQGDAVGLAVVRDADALVLPPARGPAQYHRVLRALETAAPAGRWPPWPTVEALVARRATRGVTVILTDLAEREDEIELAARRLVVLGDDVRLLHVTAPAERTLDLHGPITFEEYETGARVELDADAARERYLAARAGWLREVRAGLERRGVLYAELRLDEPLDAGLRRALAVRGSLAGRG